MGQGWLRVNTTGAYGEALMFEKGRPCGRPEKLSVVVSVIPLGAGAALDTVPAEIVAPPLRSNRNRDTPRAFERLLALLHGRRRERGPFAGGGWRPGHLRSLLAMTALKCAVASS